MLPLIRNIWFLLEKIVLLKVQTPTSIFRKMILSKVCLLRIFCIVTLLEKAHCRYHQTNMPVHLIQFVICTLSIPTDILLLIHPLAQPRTHSKPEFRTIHCLHFQHNLVNRIIMIPFLCCLSIGNISYGTAREEYRNPHLGP